MNIEIANRLLQLRKEHGFSQEDLAAKIGISRQSVSKWERAEASPDTDNLIALARLYGVSLDELLLSESGSEEAGGEKEDDRREEPINDAESPLNEAGTPNETTAALAAGPQSDPELALDPIPQESSGMSPWLAFPYPVFVTILFLLLGFLGNWWHPAWILFLTVPLYYSLVDVIIHKRSFHHFPYPILTAVVFLLLGCFGWWHPGWLVFLTIPLYYALFPEQES